jgi:signal transduction histidine kinase
MTPDAATAERPPAAGTAAPVTRATRSIARRMLAASALWSLLVLALAGWSLQALYRAETERRLDADIEATIQTLATAVDSGPSGELVFNDAQLPNDPRFRRALSGWYWAFIRVDASAAVTGADRSRSLFDAQPAISEALVTDAVAEPGRIRHADIRGPDDALLRTGVQALRLPARDTPILLYVAMDRTAADAAVERFTLQVALMLSVLAAGLIAGVVAMIRFGLRPLNAIQDKLADVRSGRREVLDGDYPRELFPLVQEINTLVAHNRKVVERARTQVGNLAHALKTPLAVLMNEARGEERISSELVRRQADGMLSNVTHYLKRAQAAAQAGVLGARADVADAAEGIARMLERLHRDKNLAILVDADPQAIFRGERGDLDELVGNLLENAAKWCKSRVNVKVARRLDEIDVIVDDDGPGLRPEDRAKALERGKRLDESAPGSGLGLSIVAELADIYGGRFHLEDSPLGGLRARLILPAAPT